MDGNKKYGCPNAHHYDGIIRICELDEGHDGSCEILLPGNKRVILSEPPVIVETDDRGNKK